MFLSVLEIQGLNFTLDHLPKASDFSVGPVRPVVFFSFFFQVNIFVSKTWCSNVEFESQQISFNFAEYQQLKTLDTYLNMEE